MPRSNLGLVVSFTALLFCGGLCAAQSEPTAETQGAPAASVADPAAKFEIADIHPSPSRRYSQFDGAFLVNGRYLMRQATVADLIATAFGLKDSSYVHGGPSWLEWNRWDVIAKVPPGTTQAGAKQMLQSLLKERFHLVVHNGTGPMAAYLLTLAKDQPSSSLKPSSGTEEGTCTFDPSTTGPQPPGFLSTPDRCHNVTMEKFAEILPTQANAYLPNPVVDKTGLKGSYDFSLQWTALGRLQAAGPDGVSVFAAVEKLGLKLTLGTAPGPVFLVDSVDETPTTNSPDLAKIMPPAPPAQFEVATIRPSAPDERGYGRVERTQVNVHAMPLNELVDLAWDLNDNDAKNEIIGAPKWLDSARWDVEAKLASESMGQGSSAMKGAPPISLEDLRDMIKQLLIDRFEMKTHMEERPQDAYAIVAVSPKMTKADPSERTRCFQGPGPDGKDPRLAHPIMNMLVTCQNVTMEQAAILFPTFAAWYLHYPAVDRTGLKGGWDFTLNWSSGDRMPVSGAGQGSADGQNANTSDPNGAVSFYDAVSKQLGLKLVKEKRPEPVLVIDHMDDQPTPN